MPLESTATIFLPGDSGILFFWIFGILTTALFSLWLQKRPFHFNRPKLTWFAGLSLLVLVLTPVLGIDLPGSEAIKPGETPLFRLLPFGAIPFTVAGMILGPLPATILAGLTGVWLAYGDTHNLFTPLVLMVTALLFSWAVRQDFHGQIFKGLQFPLGAALFSWVFVSPLVTLATALSNHGSAAERAAWGAEAAPLVMLALGGMLLVGGLVCLLLRLIFKKSWIDAKQGAVTPLLTGRIWVIFAFALTVILTAAFFGLWHVSINHVLAGLGGGLIDAAWDLTWRGLLIVSGGVILSALSVWFALRPYADGAEAIKTALAALYGNDFEKGISKKIGKPIQDVFKTLKKNEQRRADAEVKLLELSSQLAEIDRPLDALQQAMTAGLGLGALAVRVILTEQAVRMIGVTNPAYGLGQYANRLAGLDLDVLALAADGEPLYFNQRKFTEFLPGTALPPEVSVVIIAPIKWKNLRLGVYWAVHSEHALPGIDQRHRYGLLAGLTGEALVRAKTNQDVKTWQVRVSEAFNQLPDALLILDERDKILSVNHQAQKVFDFEPALLEGKRLTDLLAPNQLTPLDEIRQADGVEKQVRFINGRMVYLISNPVWADGQHLGQVVRLSEHAQLEREAEKKSNYVTIVSHELRTPISLILGYAKILRLTGNLNEQQKAYTANIIDGLNDMKMLVGKLLDVEQVAGEARLDLEPIKVQDLVSRAVESLEAQAKMNKIKFLVDLEEAPKSVQADPFYIDLALKNYLENAIKFSKMGDEVHVKVSAEGDEVIFAVQDRGIGVAPLDQKRLFMKFGKANQPAGQPKEGSGLGLAIVRSVVELHGGQTWMESQLGKGSTFYFSIPQQNS